MSRMEASKPRQTDRSVALSGPLAEELRREAAALNLDPAGLLASIVRPYVLAVREARHEVTASGRGLGRGAPDAFPGGSP